MNQAYRILRVTFTALPIITGIDKFLHVLVESWVQYLAPAIAAPLPVHPETFMNAVGIVEIAIGVVVAVRPRYGGYLLAVWLWGIIANLLIYSAWLDIALRDLGLSFGALALARLAETFEQE